jgi:hypothetical protein
VPLALDLTAIGQIDPVGGYLRDLLAQYQQTFNQFVELYEESALPDQPILLSWNLQPLLAMDNGQYLYESLASLQNQFNLLSTNQLSNTDVLTLLDVRAFPQMDPNGYLDEAAKQIQGTMNDFIEQLP